MFTCDVSIINLVVLQYWHGVIILISAGSVLFKLKKCCYYEAFASELLENIDEMLMVVVIQTCTNDFINSVTIIPRLQCVRI